MTLHKEKKISPLNYHVFEHRNWNLNLKLSPIFIVFFRSNDFKEDDAIWKNGEDGGAGGGGPPPQGGPAMGPTGGYVAK